MKKLKIIMGLGMLGIFLVSSSALAISTATIPPISDIDSTPKPPIVIDQKTCLANAKVAYNLAIKTAKETNIATLKKAKEAYTLSIKTAKETNIATLKKAKEVYLLALKEANGIKDEIMRQKAKDAATKTHTEAKTLAAITLKDAKDAAMKIYTKAKALAATTLKDVKDSTTKTLTEVKTLAVTTLKDAKTKADTDFKNAKAACLKIQ